MNSSTCAVLASAFPVMLLTIVVETRNIHVKIRQLGLFRILRQVGVSLSLVGIAFAVIGVATSGFGVPAAVIMWAIFAGALISFGMLVLMMVATNEIKDENEGSQLP